MVITNSEQLNEALAWLETQEYVAYDTETTGLNPRKDKVIGFGFSSSERGFYLPTHQWSAASGLLQDIPFAIDAAKKVLWVLKSKKLLMFNTSFDARFTKYNFGIDLVPALHADVLLLKHTCDEEYPFGLKELAAKHWGTDAKKEKEELLTSIKANGGSAKEYYKASTDVLGRYCIADCTLTYRLFELYRKELKKQNLEQFYYNDEVLPLYKEVTIPMEEAGIALDLPLLQNSLVEIKKDLGLLEDRIQDAIRPKLGLFTDWFLNKDYPTTTYKTGKPSAWTKKYNSQLEAWAAEAGGYMFNLLSKHHLKKLFFDTLKEAPLSKTPKGNPQVDEEFLELMGKKYEWCRDLITYNKLTKLKGTYIERFLDEHEDGIFYPSFQQHRTVSGRYSGDLQQLPRPLQDDGLVSRYTNRIRAFFVSAPDSVLMSADYEQLEPRVFAHTSGDTALRDIFLSGRDFYTTIGCSVLGLDSLTKEQRQGAKVYSLGIPYGLTGYKLKFELNIEQDEADYLVEQYLSAFPQLRAWMEESKFNARDHGFVKSQLGRVRRLGRIRQIREKYGPCIEDDLQLWKQLHEMPALYERAKSERREYKNYLNNAINFQIQSAGASIMNRASIAIARELKRLFLRSQLVGQVHDELILHVPISEQQQVAEIVKNCMENTTKISIPLKTTPQCATNYGACK